MYALRQPHIKAGTTLCVGPNSKKGRSKIVYKNSVSNPLDGSILHELELFEGENGKKRPVKVLFKPDLAWGNRWLATFVENGVEPNMTEYLAVKALARMYGLVLMASLPAGYNTLVFRRKRNSRMAS